LTLALRTCVSDGGKPALIASGIHLATRWAHEKTRPDSGRVLALVGKRIVGRHSPASPPEFSIRGSNEAG